MAADVARRFRRWLRVDLRDALDLSATAEPGVGAAPPGVSTSQIAVSPLAAPADFERGLRRLAAPVRRRWATVVLVRSAAIALDFAALAAVIVTLASLSWAWVAVLAAAVFIALTSYRLTRPPATAEVARVLDDRLGLFDILATTLELERAGATAAGTPGAAVLVDGTTAVRLVGPGLSARPRVALAELATAGAAAAVVLALALTGGGGSGNGAAQVAGAFGSPAARARRQHAAAADSAPSSRRPRAQAGARSGIDLSLPPGLRSPNGRREFGPGAKSSLSRSLANQPGSYVKTGAGKGTSALPSASQRGAPVQEPDRKEEAESQQQHQSLHAENGKEPPAGQNPIQSLAIGAPAAKKSVSPVQSPKSGSTHSSQGSRGATAPGSSSSSRQSATGGAGQRGAGSPSGSPTAGGQSAGTQGAKVASRGGQASGALPVQAGFAPIHAGKQPTSSQGPRDAQGGGGHGRTAGVSGTAFVGGGGGAFSYVPPDSGVASGAESGLYERYLNALDRIQGLRW